MYKVTRPSGKATLTALAGLVVLVLVWQNCALRHRLHSVAWAQRAAHRTRGGRVSGGDSWSSAENPGAGAGAAGAGQGGQPGDRGPAAGADGAGQASGEALDADQRQVAARTWGPQAIIGFFRPHPGEDLGDYRDRVLPVVQAAIAPQRVRVAGDLDQLTRSAHLDQRQLDTLDAAVSDASDAIVNRVWQALGTNEVWPRFKPSAGVEVAADLLIAVRDADRRFRASLSPEQQAALDASAFDVADYLLFSVPWAERFGIAPGGDQVAGGER